ncbi:hypothetical protein LCGC14_1744030 [marine sediment metagenome]|uniref:Helix-turn-helix domain-containing protein n=1 Tax=marine sediment metagenome TaxID=412755 RepID=A0A0F9H5T0_9ZZZZ
MLTVEGCPICHDDEPWVRTMNVKTFAKLMGVSPSLAYEHAAKNNLPVKVIRINKRMLLSKVEVHQLLHD